ncbi:MAG: hypothetical protein IMF17_00290 [Proteobacteria bacterium]|nr:hypothetical protein [Pseudomonadota bacterium]
MNKIVTNIKISAIAITSALVLSSCFDDNKEKDIPLAEVPVNIVTVVQNTLPGISLTEAEVKVKNDSTIYELEGKLINGKEYEIKITADGTIIKIELED